MQARECRSSDMPSRTGRPDYTGVFLSTASLSTKEIQTFEVFDVSSSPHRPRRELSREEEAGSLRPGLSQRVGLSPCKSRRTPSAARTGVHRSRGAGLVVRMSRARVAPCGHGERPSGEPSESVSQNADDGEAPMFPVRGIP